MSQKGTVLTCRNIWGLNLVELANTTTWQHPSHFSIWSHLCNETSNAHHCQASVVQLLGDGGWSFRPPIPPDPPIPPVPAAWFSAFRNWFQMLFSSSRCQEKTWKICGSWMDPYSEEGKLWPLCSYQVFCICRSWKCSFPIISQPLPIKRFPKSTKANYQVLNSPKVPCPQWWCRSNPRYPKASLLVACKYKW